MSIKVVVADSNRMACELLSGALQRSRSFEVVACAANPRELLEAAHRSQPDVAVISADLQDGRLSGFTAIRELATVLPRVRIIVLVENPSRELVVDAFRAGVKGIFRRSEGITTLCKCISAVHNGQIWANSVELQSLLEALSNAVPLRVVNANGKRLLTEREEQLVRLVAEGMTNREISQRLKISEHTVKNYMFRIFDKLGISSRVELILYALSRQDVPTVRDVA